LDFNWVLIGFFNFIERYNILLLIVTVTILIKQKCIIAMLYFVDVQLENDMIYESHEF